MLISIDMIFNQYELSKNLNPIIQFPRKTKISSSILICLLIMYKKYCFLNKKMLYWKGGKFANH